MAEVIGAKVEIDASSVGNVRKQLKEATAELVQMQQKFGATSQEALAAAKRVAELKDQIQEARETADLFDPGNKFKAFGNAVGAVAQGFTAVQGAMGMFGVESKELEKQLLQVQSAMAFSQGISGVLDSAKHFKNLAVIVKTNVVSAFTTLRGAIAATGIGLLISGVALLIENFDAVKKVIYDTFPALKGLFDNMDRIKQIARGVGEVILKWVTGPMKSIIKIVQGDFKGAIEEVKGMFAITKNFREGEAKAIKAQAEEKEAARQEELKKEKEKNAKLAAERARAAKAAAEKRAAELAKEKADYDKRNADRLKQEEDLQKQIDGVLTGYRKKQEDDDAKSAANKLRLEKQRAIENLQLLGANSTEISIATRYWNGEIKKEEDKSRNESLSNLMKNGDAKVAAVGASLQKQRDLNAQYAQAELAADQALQQAKASILSAGFQLLGSIFQNNRKIQDAIFAVEKAVAIATVIVNTQKEIAGYFASYSAAGPVGLGIATKLAIGAKIRAGVSIATIAAQAISKYMNRGGGGGNVGGPTITPGGGAPIAAAISPQAQLQLQNQQAINNLGNQGMRAYILNSDIRNTQQRNAYLQRNSRIG